ncbi:MAG TPA: hypothetical protein VF071_00485 [Candidatus Limnocylindria bacterium]
MIRVAASRRAPGPRTLVGVAVALLLGALLAARPADPAAADPAAQWARQQALVARAEEADAALLALQEALQAARDEARRGAALVLDGDDPPASSLTEAARLLDAAAPESAAAVAAMDRLRGTAAATRAGISIPIVPEPGQLASIADQLRDSAGAVDPFVERRRAAQRTLQRLGSALAALEDNDPAAALAPLEEAREARAVLADWEPAPVTLDLWLETTDRMIVAADAIAEATLAGDAEGVREAAADYAAAAEEARRADVSLGLSLSEAGSALTATPMRRLADALAEVERARAVVASLLQTGSQR